MLSEDRFKPQRLKMAKILRAVFKWHSKAEPKLELQQRPSSHEQCTKLINYISTIKNYQINAENYPYQPIPKEQRVRETILVKKTGKPERCSAPVTENSILVKKNQQNQKKTGKKKNW
jgi:hypothetical protein